MIGLVGYTGTVGSHISEQYFIDKCYNSKNIDSINKDVFDILFIAGIRAEKYLANRDSNADRFNIQNLINNLKSVSAKKVVLISTIDVHNNDYYGINRLWAESEISKLFDTSIIRLPGLVGSHIKKNFIYDICHPDKDLSYTSINSIYEFMNLEDIHKFIDLAIFKNINVLEIRSEPVSVIDICNYLDIDKKFLNTSKGVVYSHTGKNYYSKEEELNFIKEYVQNINLSYK